MIYQPPPFDIAHSMFNTFKDFLISCGGHYAERWGKSDEDTHLLISIATGQFLYKKDSYFICWFMVSDEGLQQLKDRIRPTDLTGGNRMWVLECGMKSDLKTLRRQLRKRGKDGIYWHRVGKGLKDFPHQKGANHG